MDRCSKCKKKTLMMYACTCRKTFCTKCRMPEDHACTFDHAAAYRELLAIKNQKVVAQKLEPL